MHEDLQVSSRLFTVLNSSSAFPGQNVPEIKTLVSMRTRIGI